MFSRKLKALGYHHPEIFNIDDERQYRSCVVWLENQKIRFYKIEERDLLTDIDSDKWPVALGNYLQNLHCPVDKTIRSHVIGWLLSHAIRLEYNENAIEYNAEHKERQNRKNTVKTENGSIDSSSLSNITSDDPDLKAGIASLSKLLCLPQHFDHITTLQAVCSRIEERLSNASITASKKHPTDRRNSKPKEGDYLPLNEINLGFSTNDSAINEAAKILRLLHIHELRDLQTKINKAIVSVQKCTANPKTDQSLGKVGR